MLRLNSYQQVCRTFVEIPKEMLDKLRPEVSEKIGQSIREIFPDLARAFPLTVDTFEQYWPKPLIAGYQFKNKWICDLLIERNDLNLYFNLTIIADPLEGDDFDH